MTEFTEQELAALELVGEVLDSSGADDGQWLVAILEGVATRSRARVEVCCVTLARAIQSRLMR